MKAFPVSTVELAKRFTINTTTDVLANKHITAKTVKVSYFGRPVNFPVIGLNLITLKPGGRG